MYKKELITESQKVNIILSYIQQHTFFSQQIRDRTHLQKAHDDSIWFGNCQKVSHFSPFSYICDDKRESLSLSLFFFLLSSFLFHTYSKYSCREYWDTCVIYDHIFLSSMQCVCTSCCSKIHPKKMRFREIFQLLDSKAIFIVFWNNRICCCTIFPILEHTVHREFWAVVYVLTDGYWNC